jgi:hypothetical protein
MAEENPQPDDTGISDAVLSDDEVHRLWEEYYVPLKLSISKRVAEIRRSVASESEIALSAFNSFVTRARAGEFPDLHHDNAHWKLLRTIAVRKANALQRNLWADRRGGPKGAVSLQRQQENGDEPIAVGNASARLEANELLATLLERLPEEVDREIILMRLEGCGTAKIAKTLTISMRKVQRILHRTYNNWTELVD